MSQDDPNSTPERFDSNHVQTLKQRKYSRLSTRLALTFSLFAILIVGLSSVTYYQSTRLELREDIKTRLHDAVAIGVKQINGDAHALLINRADEETDNYKQIKQVLQGIRDAGTQIHFVYTMRLDDQGNIIFIVDAEESEEDISHLGDIYDEASSLMINSFPTLDQPIVEQEFTADQWGNWLSGYAPIKTSDGRLEGILGMDIEASDVIARERQALWNALTLFLVSIPPIFVIGWFLGRRLANPISRLSDAAQRIAVGDFSVRTPTGSRTREVNALEISFNGMAERLQELIENLEKRVAERTQELEVATEHARNRASQLETIAQISQISTSIQIPEMLLTKIAEMISQRMGYYHVGIFLLDNVAEYAVLVASNSSGGQRMLERRHRLKIGEQGIVGNVTSSGKPRIALDVGEDMVFFNNPDLPETRSEMTLPLMISGGIIGALDLQSTEPNAFTSEDIEVLTILADQLAISIQNARSFEETTLAIRRAEAALQQQVIDTWGRPSETQAILGYRYDGVQPIPLRHPTKGGTEKALEILVRSRGQVIGRLKLDPIDSSHVWSDDEIAMAQAAAERTALALENARLLENAQRRAAKESLISKISAKIGEAAETDKIMAATVTELQKILRASEVSFRLGGEES